MKLVTALLGASIFAVPLLWAETRPERPYSLDEVKAFVSAKLPDSYKQALTVPLEYENSLNPFIADRIKIFRDKRTGQCSQAKIYLKNTTPESLAHEIGHYVYECIFDETQRKVSGLTSEGFAYGLENII